MYTFRATQGCPFRVTLSAASPSCIVFARRRGLPAAFLPSSASTRVARIPSGVFRPVCVVPPPPPPPPTASLPESCNLMYGLLSQVSLLLAKMSLTR